MTRPPKVSAKLPRLFLCALIGLLTPNLPAESIPPTDGSDIRISILTMGTGDAAWEKFGHIAIRVQDPQAQYPDVAYNWGVFDFEQKNFYINFIQGRMIYSSGAYDGPDTLQAYRHIQRTVWEQVLHLTGPQKLDIERRCLEGTRPENRDYRYDYYRDNCSTRVRDLINASVGGAIKQQTASLPSSVTFRWHTRRLTADVPWLYFTLQTLLGHPVDRPISRWEEMFLPEKLRAIIRQVTVVQPDGSAVPLIESDRVLIQGNEPPVRPFPPNQIPGALLVSIITAGSLAGLTQLALARWRGARALLLLVASSWLLLSGIAGLVMTWGWFFTDHTVAQNNENILQVNLLALAMIPLLWPGTRLSATPNSTLDETLDPTLTPPLNRPRKPSLNPPRKPRTKQPVPAPSSPRTINTPFQLATLIATLSVLGLLLKPLPFFFQVNGDIIGLCLPVNLALCWAMWRFRSRRLAAMPPKIAIVSNAAGGTSVPTTR